MIALKYRYAVLSIASASCVKSIPGHPADHVEGGKTDTRARMIRDLKSDILASYRHADSSEFEAVFAGVPLIDPRVGPARIGVGPEDVLIGEAVTTQTFRRWPLATTKKAKTAVRSMLLDVHLSSDQRVTAAWMSDQISWQIQVCGKTATLPIRVTALFVRDGYQWFEVFEHLSFGRTPVSYPELRGAIIADEFSDLSLADYPNGTLGAPLAAVLSDDVGRIGHVVAVDPPRKAEADPGLPAPTFLLGPAATTEWHGETDVTHATLHVAPVQPEGRRVGMIGSHGTLAYWVGTFIADLPGRPGVPGGKARLRGTFVFEKRCTTPGLGCIPDKWVVVQGHVSESIDDAELARRAFGSVLSTDDPLRFDCSQP